MRAGLIGAATVLALIALVVGGIVVSRAHQSTPIPVVAESSAAPTPPSAIPDGPWQAYDFVAEALPGLMPTAPADVSYGHSACQPVNARFEPVNDLGTAVPIARIMCTPTEDARYIANYIVICSSDRTPQTLAGVADGMVAVRTERWARGGESGQVVYGTHDNAGALAVGFDGAARNFCSVVANGRDRTSGQDMYDHWFRDAPL